MTEETVTENPTDTTTEATLEPPTTETPDDTSKPGREAAKYRRQLRDTETERDTLKNSLHAARTELLRAHLTAHAIGGKQFNLDALQDAGIDTEEIFTNGGTLDPEAFETLMSGLLEHKPYMFTELPKIRAGAESAAFVPQADFDTAFAPKR
ncbi:hypothetical protein [Leucobacter sp. G161]|uniref:hypothetical protein n=1 Tax=Leucobacter sp. G161 TaxID=663704 RepID=UPI00073B9F14|nr:hypothetical protein [Leucobacter sp. G161]KUF06767.1 hypothetical protein AUL38_10945 [Leucobacter sp. G161]